ncbi:MAG: phosphodiester glycosidase family protein [Lachnospiraceae bacterium]|nr:phosphodiester glycosidase family protein [Lachnospiraceae bacterium]
MARIKKLTQQEYQELLRKQDQNLDANDEYLEDEYYEDGEYYEEGDGYYEDEEAYEDGEYYEDEEAYDDGEYYDEEAYEESDGYYEDEEAYEGDEYYEDGEYYEEEAYEEDDDGDLEYLDEEEFYDENGRSVSDPLYGKKEEKPVPVYEEIPLPRRSSRTSTGGSSRTSGSRTSTGGYSANRSGKKKKRSIGAKIWGVVWRVLVFLLVTIVLLGVFLYGAVKLILKGPSSAMSTQYVSTFHETSALKWLPGVFLSEEEVEAILAKNMMPEAEVGTVSDKDLIVIDETPKEDVDPIVVEEIFGATYHGYMMIVQDPSTVYLGVIDQFAQSSGWIVPAFAEKYGAIGGVNGGEFVDMGSYSYTAMPVGGVISQGQGLFENNAAGAWNLVCMTNENKLLLLKGYSVKAALDMGVRDGCHVRHETGPFLIIDGESLEVPDTEVYGGGKNPRTAIGQRSDGVMLLCVIDGRQASSLGATFKDMIDIMKEYGAVNAACLDGGTSSQMYYNGEIINNPYSPTGPRRCPTAWLVGGGNTNG